MLIAEDVVLVLVADGTVSITEVGEDAQEVTEDVAQVVGDAAEAIHRRQATEVVLGVAEDVVEATDAADGSVRTTKDVVSIRPLMWLARSRRSARGLGSPGSGRRRREATI